jgi:hypothetical protein
MWLAIFTHFFNIILELVSDKYTRKLSSINYSLSLFLVLILVSAENLSSHKYDMKKLH